MRPLAFSLMGPRGLCSCCWLFFAPRSRLGGAGGPKFAERSRPPGPEGKPPGRGPTVLARAGLARRQVAPLEGLRVEFPDDLVGERPIGELDEGEPARAPG